MEEKDHALEVLVRSMKNYINHSTLRIETIARKLDENFEELEATKLPEYQAAIDAIKAYQEALASHFTEKYKFD